MKPTLLSLLIIPLLPLLSQRPDNAVMHSPAIATDTLHWDTETCHYIGTFDRSKYKKEQLRGAFRLWFTNNALQISTRHVVLNAKEYYSFDSKGQLLKLEKEYAGKKAGYAAMKVPPGRIWSDLLQNRIKDLDETYELAMLSLKAHSNPSVLLKNRFAQHCPEYIEALASEDTELLMAAWQRLKAKKDTGSFTESGFNNYKNSLTQEMKIAAARTDLLTFGWYNCANSQIHHDLPNIPYSGEFEKLFLSVEEECDE
ncbi:hypothetical protein [Flavobacterium sp.]|uniref:hypothetical protein n=1 Tax=Flavobacterium sp. TaxID=239 RepID=UPI004034897A